MKDVSTHPQTQVGHWMHVTLTVNIVFKDLSFMYRKYFFI